MTLIIFKYCLPILLGYILFAGIADRYFPLFRPKELIQRPRWFLGLWSGAAFAILGIIGLDIAYKSDVSKLPALLTPAIWITGLALVPGIVGYLYYRSVVKRQLSANSTHFDVQTSTKVDPTVDSPTALESEDDLFTNHLVEANDQYSRWADNLNHNFADQFDDQEEELDHTQLLEVSLIPTGEPEFTDRAIDAEASLQLSASDTLTILEVGELDADETLAIPGFDFDATLKLANIDTDTELELTALEADNTLALSDVDVDATLELSMFDADATLRLPKPHVVESEKITALTKLEQQLEDKIKSTSAAEARAEREAQMRISLEEEIIHLREEALKSSTDSRESTEAQARAVSTASKATTIACKAMQVRTRLEDQLHEAQSDLDRSRETIRQLKLALKQGNLGETEGPDHTLTIASG